MSPTRRPKDAIMPVDERSLRELLTESNDLHLDAQAKMVGSLDEFAAIRNDRAG